MGYPNLSVLFQGIDFGFKKARAGRVTAYNKFFREFFNFRCQTGTEIKNCEQTQKKRKFLNFRHCKLKPKIMSESDSTSYLTLLTGNGPEWQ